MSAEPPFTNLDDHYEIKNDIFKVFDSRKTSLKFIALMRWRLQTRSRGIWNAGAICPKGHMVQSVDFVDHTYRYYCSVKDCRKLFSPVYGTLFEQSRVPLWKWFVFIFLYGKKMEKMSGRAISKHLKVSTKTGVAMKKALGGSLPDQKDLIYSISRGIIPALNA